MSDGFTYEFCPDDALFQAVIERVVTIHNNLMKRTFFMFRASRRDEIAAGD